MATAYSLDRWLRRIEQTQRPARVQRERFAEAERLLREGDPISRQWMWFDPVDGSTIEMAWVPEMGPWHTLEWLILAGEDVAHGLLRRDASGHTLTLEDINRALIARANQAAHVTGKRFTMRSDEADAVHTPTC